jgi:hypothetical protein
VLFLETFYEVKLERSHPNLLCILFIDNKGHQLKKINFQKLRSVAMATIPPKIWSWRGHSSGQNLLFFQVIKIKMKELYLYICILFIDNKGH